MSVAGGVSPDPNVATVVSAALYGHTWACPDDPESEPPRDECECCARVVLEALAAAGFAVVPAGLIVGTVKSFRDVEGLQLYDAATHRWIDLLAASFSVGGLPVGEEADSHE